ncbi:MAG: M24 family metallopeptidase [Candidatus Phytoplasma sp.]|nr:M24 family metallopeptidase [Phytoplasma sp.]
MFKHNRDNYLKNVEDQSISIFYSGVSQHKSADQTFPFVVNRNFYYLSGIEQENVVLMLIKGNKTQKSFLFIEKQDPIKALWDGATLTFEEASIKSGIDITNIFDISQFDDIISQYLGFSRRALFGPIHSLYFDLERSHVKQGFTKANLEANLYQKLYPQIKIKNSFPIVSELRKIKSEYEVNKIRKAIEITDKALNHLLKTLKPNMYEYQIEAEYDYILGYHRVKPSFNTIAASGKNGTILHYVDNDQQMKDNDLILFDLGVSYENYCSDISRTYPVNGKFTERQKQIYEIVLEANKKTIEWVKPGHTHKEFNDYGKQILINGLKKIGLIKEDHEITKYYYHSLGHYLGLDVHDVGDTTKVIESGAILTVEPGLYIAEENIGIRIEDDILITDKGAINLSSSIIKEIEDIEAYMKK